MLHITLLPQHKHTHRTKNMQIKHDRFVSIYHFFENFLPHMTRYEEKLMEFPFSWLQCLCWLKYTLFSYEDRKTNTKTQFLTLFLRLSQFSKTWFLLSLFFSSGCILYSHSHHHHHFPLLLFYFILFRINKKEESRAEDKKKIENKEKKIWNEFHKCTGEV